jgi:UDPglucose 6-dehydrogenase
VFGASVERACFPERLIIGCANPSDTIDGAFGRVLSAFGCPVLRMSYESAELTKIAINVCLAASITATNVLSGIASRVGADWGEIAPALRLDERIGLHAYLTPGLGIGGGHLTRDLVTVSEIAKRTKGRGYVNEADAIDAMLRDSVNRQFWPLRMLKESVLYTVSDPVIGVLGVTYKKNTQSVRNSPSIALIKQLVGTRLRVFDPAVIAPTQPGLVNAESMESVALGADALVIMTPWPVFRTLDVERVGRDMRGRIIIDPFGVLDHERVRAAGFRHFVLGRSNDA